MPIQSANDLDVAVPKFCLALEKDRRTNEGRIRSDKEFREHFFPYDESSARDLLLCFMPREVRGPVIASWGIRGQKAAMRDDDARVLSVVHDAFVAGDIDDQLYEQGLLPDVVVAWGDLTEWWNFYRAGKHTKYSLQVALETAYDLGLFDARWFFEVLESGAGKLRGTDVLAEGLSKSELTEWVKNIHQSGDGSPKGVLSALGWSTLVNKTANNVLLAVIDAIALKNELVRVKPPSGDDSGRRSNPPPLPAETHSAPPAEGAPAVSEMPSSRKENEDGDWLENPINMGASDNNDDLDVLIDTSILSSLGGNELESMGKELDEHERKTDPPFGEEEDGNVPTNPPGSKRRAPPPLPESVPPPHPRAHKR